MQLEWTDQELVAMPRVNVELLDQTLDYIIDHPDEWRQSAWGSVSEESPCGATYCFAGHTCLLAGEDMVIKGDEIVLVNEKGWMVTAQDLLGLTEDEAYNLFIQTLYEQPGQGHMSSKEFQLHNVKVEVERIRARAKAQDEAFNRIAQEFIDAAGLEDVAKPGYQCPESEEAVQRLTGGAKQ